MALQDTPSVVSDSLLAVLLADYDGRDRPGACLLVQIGGSTQYRRCYGMADLEGQRSADVRTNFRLASVTKQFTAASTMLLVEAGKLRYDDTLGEIFPSFPAYGAGITVRHLLTHTAGLVSYESLLPATQTHQVKDRDVLQLMIEQDSTYFPPGSSFRYSNSAYAVLAMTVERMSGQPFARFLEANIFKPLKMRHTVAFEEGVSTVAHRAFGYSRRGTGWIRTDQSATSAVLGDGGIYTSIEDYEKWLRVVEGRRDIMTPRVWAEAFRPAVLENGDPTEYGLGWFLDEFQGQPRIQHAGSTMGFRNAVEHFPLQDLSIIFLSNRNEGSMKLADSVASLFLVSMRKAGSQ